MIKNIYFLLFLIFTSSLFSNDLLTNYRLHGIENIQKQMDLELTKKEYWENYLQDTDTTFGFLENHSAVLCCNKESSTLQLYKKNKKQEFEFIKQYDAFTGKLKGDKVKEGDLRTPIGIYDLTKKIEKLDSFYGPLAFVTSYPNSYDRYRGKNGSGIWIHGLPTEQERDEFTKGCIAINNQSIECLNKNIDIDNTLLIIDKSKPKQKSKEKLITILSELFSWRNAWIYNDVDKYLNFYSDDFIRFDGMDINKFTTYKKRIFKKAEKKTILFNDINIMPYPNTEHIYQITFKEYYKSDSFEFTGNKSLMVKLTDDDKMKIFTEK